MVTPSTTSLKSMFAPCGPGTSELMHSLPGGAVPIVPKNGRSGTSTLPILLFGRSSMPTFLSASRCQMNSLSGTGSVIIAVLYSGASAPKYGIDAAPAKVPVQADVVDAHDQRVAGLGALDVERSGLRVDRRQVELGHHRLVRRREHVIGRVPGAGLDRVAGVDARRRRMGVAIGEVDGVAGVVFDLGREGRRAQRSGERRGQDRQAHGRSSPTDLLHCRRDLPRCHVSWPRARPFSIDFSRIGV